MKLTITGKKEKLVGGCECSLSAVNTETAAGSLWVTSFIKFFVGEGNHRRMVNPSSQSRFLLTLGGWRQSSITCSEHGRAENSVLEMHCKLNFHCSCHTRPSRLIPGSHSNSIYETKQNNSKPEDNNSRRLVVIASNDRCPCLG